MDGWRLGKIVTAVLLTDAVFDVAISGKVSRQLWAWVLLFCEVRLLPMGLKDVVCVGATHPSCEAQASRLLLKRKTTLEDKNSAKGRCETKTESE